MSVKMTFLGTGTSQGVPVASCPCAICKSTDPRDSRLRTSAMFTVDGKNIVVDTGPDFRQQMLKAKVMTLDGVIFTHEHKDHLAGMDDIRAFNFTSKKAVDIYAVDRVQEAIKREYQYIFDNNGYPGIPLVNLHTIHEHLNFFVSDVEIKPITVLHYKLPVLGFRVGDIVYITDANHIPEESKVKIQGAKVLVLNALRREKHISHFNLEEAVAMAKELGAEMTYFTHISHQLGSHKEVEKELPPNIRLAYDGLVVGD